MLRAVIAEKPAVARDIAQVLGARDRGDGCFRGGGYVVSWAIGHLVGLAEPHELDPRWKAWRFGDLPILPLEWRLVVSEETRDQFDNVARVLNAPDVDEIVCATDAGREGELIFRYIYEAARCAKPVRRLWISSLTPDAIAQGFRDLRQGRAYDALARAARARSRADWLVGMNLSRAYSIAHDQVFSVGRVQTPTLAMVVARELEIRSFVPEDYFEVVATFRPTDRPAAGTVALADDVPTYAGTWFRGDRGSATDARRLPRDGKEAAEITVRVNAGTARLQSVERESRTIPPPFLYDLTELQRHANRLYGLSAQRTLDVAQALYEKRKLISYPRTDSRRLSRSVAETLPDVVRAIAEPYRARLAPGTGERPLGARFVDDARVTDHHAILPTTARPPADLQGDEARIYDLVCRRLLSAWHDDHVLAVTKVVTAVTSRAPGAEPVVDRFASSGNSVERLGWKTLDIGPDKQDNVIALPPGLRKGAVADVVDSKALAKQTRPPPRLTDASLLTAMEHAGRTVSEKELAAAMRECGLGTPATRAATIETLLKREYVVRDGKTLVATDKGVTLIDVVHANVKTPAMTGEWEAKLAAIEEGTGDFDAFMRGIEGYVRDVVGTVTVVAPPRSGPPTSAAERAPSARRVETASLLAAPASCALSAAAVHTPARPVGTSSLASLLHERFGFAGFRPYQEAVCRASAAGRDVLLVMPTGAGKSLCYQLPGLARGGTTLVVSPLIALMEDQVDKLVRLGLRAACIHSGRGAEAARTACRAYLDGRLNFLFIAPERLKVPGFPEMLARRPPTLVAVDEAHCISQWGHDFRPEYRMLGERLPLLRPAPIIALTATATPTVQDDIVAQLRLDRVERFIHGFRRTNIGVEIIEKQPGDRADAVFELLSRPERRPAIVYAPTRREAESLAKDLSRRARVDVYHAGLPVAARARAQTAFLAGEVDVVVATIAFGMGIDKADVRTVVHTALPATVEGYYQEIGRAGRDGAPSRAILFHSFVDTKTHQFFLERDYPALASLQTVYDALGDRPIDKDALRAASGLHADVFEKTIEKLWLHGGARIDPDESMRRGEPTFAVSYESQRAHRMEQIARMRRYVDNASCRMLQLVHHFGDENDSGAVCGVCDVCSPDGCVAQVHREPSAAERSMATRVLAALTDRESLTVGQLQRDVLSGDVERRDLEHVLAGLAQAGIVRLDDDSFVKDGTVIQFKRARLVRRSGAASPDRVAPAFRIVGEPLRKARPARGGPAAGRGKTDGKSKRARGAKAKAPGRARVPSAARAATEASGTARTRTAAASARASTDGAAAQGLFDALRAWRLDEAKRTKLPAFRILNDRTLLGIASAAPGDEGELLRVAGMGPGLTRKYGATLLGIVARFCDR